MNQNDITRAKEIANDELKEQQLAFREAEMEETVRVLRLLNDGEGERLREANPRGEGISLPMFEDRLDVNRSVVAGHSYGATGTMRALKDAPSHALPFQGAIVLDPGKSSGPLNDKITVPTLIINSGSWTKSQSDFYGRPHFEVVRERMENLLERGKAAWFMTLLGTAHPSVTDAPLIEKLILRLATRTTLDARVAVGKYVEASMDFLGFVGDGKRRGILAKGVTNREGPLGEERQEGRAREMDGWEVHVAPPVEGTAS